MGYYRFATVRIALDSVGALFEIVAVGFVAELLLAVGAVVGIAELVFILIGALQTARYQEQVAPLKARIEQLQRRIDATDPAVADHGPRVGFEVATF